MSSRKHSLVAIERRLRRAATRHYLHFMIAQKPDVKVKAHGGYMLRDARTMAIVLGDKSYLYSASLEEVTEYLDKLDEAEAAAG
jgi:hypothetical protein